MWCIYWVIRPPDVEVPGVRTQPVEPAQKPPEKPKQPTMDPPVQIQVPLDADGDTPVTTLDVQVETPETPNEAPTDSTLGDPNDVADSQVGGPGLNCAIGVGGPPMGPYGLRKGGHKRAIRIGHGCKGGEDSVNAALRWFKKHQSPNGKWDTVGYYRNCTDNPKCEPGIVDHCSVEGSDVAMTGYALYCFLGAGYDQRTGQYQKVVQKGIDYLLSVQKADGYLGERNYENAIATMALCQAYGMTEDPALKGPAQRGVDQILAHENQVAGGGAGYGTGLGWDYVGPSNRNDSSVTGWNVMALKSAFMAGLDVKNGLESTKHWLETVWKKQNPDWARLDAYKGESRFPYTYMTDTGATEIAPAPGPGQPAPNATDLTCVGTMCAVFLGHHAGDPMLESLSNYVINHQIPASPPATPITCIITPCRCSSAGDRSGRPGTARSATCWFTPSAVTKGASTAAGTTATPVSPGPSTAASSPPPTAPSAWRSTTSMTGMRAICPSTSEAEIHDGALQTRVPKPGYASAAAAMQSCDVGIQVGALSIGGQARGMDRAMPHIGIVAAQRGSIDALSFSASADRFLHQWPGERTDSHWTSMEPITSVVLNRPRPGALDLSPENQS